MIYNTRPNETVMYFLKIYLTSSNTRANEDNYIFLKDFTELPPVEFLAST